MLVISPAEIPAQVYSRKPASNPRSQHDPRYLPFALDCHDPRLHGKWVATPGAGQRCISSEPRSDQVLTAMPNR
jgi:hypothetical protein